MAVKPSYKSFFSSQPAAFPQPVVFTLIILSLLAVLLLIHIYLVPPSRTAGPETAIQEPLSQTNRQPTLNQKSTGTIQGSLAYPSETIPQDLVVCAQPIGSQSKYCTNKKIKADRFEFGFGYQLKVPAGRYQVYATSEQLPGYRAYFSQFVSCGMSADCLSHQPITIQVSSGQTKTEINPIDWYNKDSLDQQQ